MDEPLNAANGSLQKDLIKDEAEPESTVQYGFRSASSQITVAVAQNFLLVALGMSFGMPTVILGALDHKVATNQTRLESPDLIMNDEESSWLGSILFLFHPVGAAISGYLVDSIGRKKVMIIVCFPFFLGWMFLYYAQSVTTIMIGTIAMGIGLGFCEGPIISYLGEVCEPRIRGALTLLTGVSGNMGVLAIFFINALVDWRTTSLISSIIPLLAIVMLLFLPESPTWLISKGRMADAEQSLRWLRGWSKKDKVRVEFDQIVRGIEKSSKDANRNASRNISKIDKIRNELNYFKRPEIIRPFNMLIILFFVTVISAFIPMRPYLVEVFQTFGLPLKSEWVLVLTGVLGITGSLISSLTVNKFGKRPMSLWSTGICFVFTLLLAICAMNLHWPGWIPLTVFCICFWIAGYGILALPWMLMSEIFPIEIRGVACGICAALNSLISFFVTKTYVNTMAWFGLHGTLFLYSFVMGVGFVYMYFYVPETEDRTLQEITDFFSENGSARSFKRPQSIHK
ncbi:facilitated trehalose transporter Tret1 [Diaphorina citri]|jgi:Arabinose efflux permease|uniref:Facilitated trehalose transporter Tret1 n=1 Tax=Diaphorina citri TaxID=121845 RepID=A0A1S3D6J6_DIACI|nr:facilitated trehalose transporter Tret1 [Diaphorina citri]